MGTAASKQQQQQRRQRQQQHDASPQPPAASGAAAVPAPPQQQGQASTGAAVKLGPMPPAEAKRWCLTIGGAKPQAAYRYVRTRPFIHTYSERPCRSDWSIHRSIDRTIDQSIDWWIRPSCRPRHRHWGLPVSPDSLAPDDDGDQPPFHTNIRIIQTRTPMAGWCACTGRAATPPSTVPGTWGRVWRWWPSSCRAPKREFVGLLVYFLFFFGGGGSIGWIDGRLVWIARVKRIYSVELRYLIMN
jgi:hypothetical protein